MLGSNEAQESQSRDLRKLDLNLLIVFETVYKTGSVSEAARVLGMTQPTVSNALARLRDHFSDQLFVRRDRSMKPTARARALLPPVKEALTALRRGLSPVSAALARFQRTVGSAADRQSAR
mgnify:CR=1 FL=1